MEDKKRCMHGRRGKVLDRTLALDILDRYFEYTTPIFTPEMGKRLARVRQLMRLTQRQLGEQLGLTQTDLSRLENGKMINAPINTAKFSFVLKEHLEYVLTRIGYYRYEEVTYEYNKQINKRVAKLKSGRNV